MVYVLSKEGKPLMPTNRQGKVRHLLKDGLAVVHQAFQKYNISLKFIHYDITSLYFEGAYEDEDLVDYGYSRIAVTQIS